MVTFGLLTAEICWRVWGTPANFNGFCVLAVLLHGTLVVKFMEERNKDRYFALLFLCVVTDTQADTYLTASFSRTNWVSWQQKG